MTLEKKKPAFVVFEKGSASSKMASDRAMISVNKTGIVLMNYMAYKALRKPDYIVLLTCRESGEIALKPAEADDPNAYHVTRSQNEVSARFSCKPFLRAFGILPEGKPNRYTCRYDDSMIIAKVTDSTLQTVAADVAADGKEWGHGPIKREGGLRDAEIA